MGIFDRMFGNPKKAKDSIARPDVENKNDDYFEVPNRYGVGDGTPLIVSVKPDLERVFNAPTAPIPQKLTNRNRDYWKTASTAEIKEALAIAYLQHPNPLIRLKVISYIPDVWTLLVMQASVDLLTDIFPYVGKAAADLIWVRGIDNYCEFTVKALRDEIRGYSQLTGASSLRLGREKAIKALDLLVSSAPNEDARRGIQRLIDRDVVIEDEERVKQVDISSVKFTVKEYINEGTFEVYKANSKEQALAFLKTKSVTEKLYYIQVETPEGNFGRDINGMYDLPKRPALPSSPQPSTTKQCPWCGSSSLGERKVTLMATRALDSTRRVGREFDATRLYCKQCGLVLNDDLRGDKARAYSHLGDVRLSFDIDRKVAEVMQGARNLPEISDANVDKAFDNIREKWKCLEVVTIPERDLQSTVSRLIRGYASDLGIMRLDQDILQISFIFDNDTFQGVRIARKAGGSFAAYGLPSMYRLIGAALQVKPDPKLPPHGHGEGNENDCAALQVKPDPKLLLNSCAVCGSSLPAIYKEMTVIGGSWGYCENCVKLFCKNHSKPVSMYGGEYTEAHCPDCNHGLKVPSVIWQEKP
jgi:hypothetical protein